MKNKTIRHLSELAKHNLIQNADLPELKKVTDHFEFSITPHMANLINRSDAHDPIAKQFLPHMKELAFSPEELQDPISDTTHTKVKGIVHRYPDRCLFKPVLLCPVYCRFCFRKEAISADPAALSAEEINHAIAYIEAHTEIWEVILTGGDPLILKPAMLKKIIAKINAIPHVSVIRIHTRVPVVDPERINKELIAAIQSNKALYIVLHANHPQEFSDEAIQACAALIDAGLPMLSQTVLLKDLNDDIDTLSELMRCFVKNRIKPYYLHHADLVRGTKHFRTSIAQGQQLMKQLRGRFSGLCQPTYVVDIPGGHGKMPIGPNYLQEKSDEYLIEDFDGEFHAYPKEE
jgi:lysine 2,3-aminomutase